VPAPTPATEADVQAENRYRPSQVAHLFHVHPRVLARACREGRVPAERVLGGMRYHLAGKDILKCLRKWKTRKTGIPKAKRTLAERDDAALADVLSM